MAGEEYQSAGCNAHRASLAKMVFSSVLMLFVCFSFWFPIFHIHFDFDLLLLLLLPLLLLLQIYFGMCNNKGRAGRQSKME